MSKNSFSDFKIAAGMRDVITHIVRAEVDRVRPESRIAQVKSINDGNLTAEVSFAGDTGSVNARFGLSLIPKDTNAIVRVAGSTGNYYITEIINQAGKHADYEPIKDAVLDPTTGLAEAYANANAAAAAAASAATDATTAQTTADGKNTVTYSLVAPGAAANAAGDIWFQKESATQTIIGQWEGLGGTLWSAKTLNNAVIANLDAGKLVAGSAFINALWVKTNFTLGDASTNGVIQSYNFAGSSVGVFIDKYGLVAKGGSITGATVTGGTVTGATVKTAGSGNRIELKGDGSAGSVEFYNSSGVLSGKIRSISTYLDVSGGGLTPAYLHLESANCSLHGEYLFLIPGSGGINMMGDIYAGSRTMAIGTLNGGGEVHGATLWSDSPRSTAQPTANVYMTAGGQLQIMTSTEAAKTNIRLAAIDVDAALQLEPKVYQSLCEADDPDADIFGFSAQQARSLGLDEWVVYEADGETVQGFSYTGWVVALQATNRRQQEQIDALTRRFDALVAAQ